MNYVLDARTATSHFPGIGRYTRNLHESILPLLTSAETISTITARKTKLSAPSNTRLAKSSPFGLAQQREIPSALRTLDADLYHSPYYLMPLRSGVPTVLTVHDFIVNYYPKLANARVRLLYGIMHRLALRTSQQIICVSESTKADLQRLFKPQQPIHVIPHAAAAHFRPIDPTHTRQKLGLPKRYLLYFGSNKPHKNIARLVEAYAQLSDAPPLVIAGAWLPEHPEPKQIAEQLAIADRVMFLGRIEREDVTGLFCGATLFVFPSLYEGFGLPVIEAMACGLPVASSNRSSLPEVGGEAAEYFEPDSAESIASTLNDLLHNPNRLAEMRQQSLVQASTFSWSRTAAETLAIYRSICRPAVQS